MAGRCEAGRGKGGGQVMSWGRAASVVWFSLGLEQTQRARFLRFLKWVTKVADYYQGCVAAGKWAWFKWSRGMLSLSQWGWGGEVGNLRVPMKRSHTIDCVAMRHLLKSIFKLGTALQLPF